MIRPPPRSALTTSTVSTPCLLALRLRSLGGDERADGFTAARAADQVRQVWNIRPPLTRLGARSGASDGQRAASGRARERPEDQRPPRPLREVEVVHEVAENRQGLAHVGSRVGTAVRLRVEALPGEEVVLD